MKNPVHHFFIALSTRFSLFRPYVAYILVANLAFWIAGALLDTLPRSTFDIDYIVVAALVPLVGIRFGIGLMSLAVAADVWRNCGSLYYFNASDVLGSLAFVSELSPLRVVSYAVVGGSLILLWSAAVVTLGNAKEHRIRVAPFAVIFFVLASVAVVGGNTSVRLSDRTKTANFANSAGISLLKTAWAGFSSRSAVLDVHEVDSATRRVGWFQNRPKHRRRVLILVESWGLPREQSWLDAVTQPLRDDSLHDRYLVESGTVPFHGPTVPAEFRELCGVNSDVVQRPADPNVLANCLGAGAIRGGEHSLYLHPFDGFMFYRRQWVPGLGFDQVLFRKKLLEAGISKCDGPFAGACDNDVVRWMGNRLASPESPGFTFLLTLNSHLPVSLTDKGANPLSCGTEQRFSGDESICELLTLIRRVHAAVAQVAMRNDLPPTEFLLVGDHAPPFLYKARRERFSQTEVPYIHLIPKDTENIVADRK